MKAGEETVGGFSDPSLRIVNVAGTRAFEEPPAGGAGRVELDDAGEVGEPVVDDPPPEGALPLVETLPLDEALPLVETLPPVEALGVAEPLVAGATPVLDEDAELELPLCPDPPHPPRHTATITAPIASTLRTMR